MLANKGAKFSVYLKGGSHEKGFEDWGGGLRSFGGCWWKLKCCLDWAQLGVLVVSIERKDERTGLGRPEP
jgi:hypothetical protein